MDSCSASALQVTAPYKFDIYFLLSIISLHKVFILERFVCKRHGLPKIPIFLYYNSLGTNSFTKVASSDTNGLVVNALFCFHVKLYRIDLYQDDCTEFHCCAFTDVNLQYMYPYPVVVFVKRTTKNKHLLKRTRVHGGCSAVAGCGCALHSWLISP